MIKCSIADFEREALRILPRSINDFNAGGAEDEHTLRANVQAFSRIPLKARAFTRVRDFKGLGTTLLGHNLASPIGLAPSGLQKLLHHDGEIASASAA